MVVVGPFPDGVVPFVVVVGEETGETTDIWAGGEGGGAVTVVGYFDRDGVVLRVAIGLN